MSSTISRGASGVFFACIFTLFTAWAVREIHLSPASARVGGLMEPAATSKIIKEYDNTELRYEFTGIEPVDFGLRFLVVAFLPGVLDFDRGIKLQSAYFLTSFFPIIAILSIEAGRERNKRSLIYFTSIWALFYQSAGGAIILALYHLAYMKTTSSPNYWSPPSRAVSTAYAQALLPSLTLGYLLPTILLYFPFGNVLITQGYVALWQVSPLIVNLLSFVLTPTYSVGQPKPKTGPEGSTSDVKYLNRVYILSFIVGVISHWGAIAICLFSSDPNLSFLHAFWPKTELFLGQNTTPTLAEGLHYIFQMDYWIIFGSSLVWAYLATLDTNLASSKSFVPPVKAFAVMTLNTVLFGPAATIAAIWYSRESTLAQLQKSKEN